MTASTYAFGGFRLDASRRLLFSADGAQVPLNSRAFDTLLCFVEHPGELLEKATLLKMVWPHTIVEENNLNQCIWALRRALGETPGEHRFIVTVPGRGYRFVAPVRVLDGADESAAEEPSPVAGADGAPAPAAMLPVPRTATQGPLSWPVHLLTLLAILVLATVVGLVSTSTPSGSRDSVTLMRPRLPAIAVLPFADMSPTRDQEVFADGLSEEVLNALGTHGQLRVIGRSSSFAFKGRNEDLRRVGRQLGADYLLEGTVRKVDGRVRVTANLVAADSGTRLWSQSFDRQAGDMLAVQTELAASIAGAMGGHLTANR